jgi:hypothetical protein
VPAKKATKAHEDSVKEQMDAAAAAEDASGLTPIVTQGVPNILVEVLPNNVVGEHSEGEQFEMDGPSALAYIQLGYVKAVSE